MRVTRTSMAVLVTAMAAILAATVRPDFSREAQFWTNCIICGERGTADALVNVILFLPFGMGLALAKLHPRRAILVGALLSAVIELAQTVIPGRDPSLGDVLFNTVGTATGVAIAALSPRATHLPARTAARLSLIAVAAFALALAGTGVLLAPSFPDTVYYGQWTPSLGHLEWYRGRVSDARIAGAEIRSRRIDDSRGIRRALLHGDPITVTATAGPPVPALASLFSVYDGSRREIVLLGPDRHDLVFRYRTRAAQWRLDQPDVRLLGGMAPLVPGASIHVREWSPAGGEYCLTGPGRQACGLGFTVGSGWGLLYYGESFPVSLRGLLQWLWTAALLLPAGFLLRPRWESVTAGALAVVALLWLPSAVALRPTSPIEWAGALTGLAVGWLASRALNAMTKLASSTIAP